jgi:hypothetical protein
MIDPHIIASVNDGGLERKRLQASGSTFNPTASVASIVLIFQRFWGAHPAQL